MKETPKQKSNRIGATYVPPLRKIELKKFVCGECGSVRTASTWADIKPCWRFWKDCPMHPYRVERK